MTTYNVRPQGTEWHVTASSLEQSYTFRKKPAAVSIAESLASGEDTVVVYRFDGDEILRRID
jgi:hypothetical protein